MEEEGTVAVWIGRCSSRESFEAVMEVSFSDDGDFLGSSFSREVRVEYFDSGLLEAGALDVPCSTLEDLLGGISYEEQVLPQLKGTASTPPWNCFVLLYSYRIDGSPKFSAAGVDLEFVGNATYELTS
jgi:hypothetical protein